MNVGGGYGEGIGKYAKAPKIPIPYVLMYVLQDRWLHECGGRHSLPKDQWLYGLSKRKRMRKYQKRFFREGLDLIGVTVELQERGWLSQLHG
jgi:hypothetical protein